MFDTAVRGVIAPQKLLCPDGAAGRRMAHDYRPEVGFTLIIPSEGVVILNTKNPYRQVIHFVCSEDRGGWESVISNIVVGLGFYKSTSDVPDELKDTREDHGELQCVLEWSENGHETVFRVLTPNQ